MAKKVRSFIALILVVVMALSLCGISALADDPDPSYTIGQTFTADASDATLPTNIPSGTHWIGPVENKIYGNLICGLEEGVIVWGTTWVEITQGEFDANSSDTEHYKSETVTTYTYEDWHGNTQTYTGPATRYTLDGNWWDTDDYVEDPNGIYGRIDSWPWYVELHSDTNTTYFKIDSTTHAHTDACYDSVTTQYIWTLADEAALAISGGDTVYVDYGSLTLSALASNFSGAVTYSWSVTNNGSNSGNRQVSYGATNEATLTLTGLRTGDGSVTVSVTATDGTDTLTETKTIYVVDAPYDHVDVEIAGGVLTVDTQINGVSTGTKTYDITVSAPQVKVDDGAWDSTPDSTLSYEFRFLNTYSTPLSTIYIKCHIVAVNQANHSDTFEADFSVTYDGTTPEGAAAIAAAASACPGAGTSNAGLDFTISATEVQNTILYDVYYDANGGDQASCPATATNVPNGPFTLDSTTTPSRAADADGTYTFAGWAATSDSTTPITSVTVNGANVTVYAIWNLVPGSSGGTMNYTLTKIWNDDSNSGSTRPSELTVWLTSGGNKVAGTEVTLTSANADPTDSNKWVYTWQNIATGSYTVAEEELSADDYTAGTLVPDAATLVLGGATKVPNCNVTVFPGISTSNFVAIKATGSSVAGAEIIVWTKADYTDPVVSAAEQAQLLAIVDKLTYLGYSGVPSTVKFITGNFTDGANSIALDGDSNLTVTYTDKNVWALFAYGTVYSASCGSSLTNTYEPTTVDISGEKIWDSSYTGTLPDSITVELLAGGNPISPARTVVVTATDNWEYEFTGLPTGVIYSVRETAIAGTTLESGRFIVYVSGTSGEVVGCWVATVDGYNITNTYYPAEDEGSGSFSVRKYITGTTTYLAGATFTLTGISDSSFTASQTTNSSADVTFGSLPVGTYTLTETAPAGYTGAGSWTVTVTDTGATYVETTGPVSNVFTNVWKWIVSVVTGDSADQLSGGVLTVYNTPNTSSTTVPASIEIYKTDGSSALAGVVFTLAGIGTDTTDASGIASFTGLAAVGTYELTESGPLTGYTGSSATWYVKVTSSENSAWNDGHTSYVTTTTYSAAIYTDSDCTILATLNNSNQLEVVNSRDYGTLTITKVSNMTLPDGFQITVTAANSTTAAYTLTTSNASSGDGSSATPYTWTVSVPTLVDYTVAESNYNINNYTCDFTVSVNGGTAAIETSATAQAGDTVAFVNTYTYQPSNTTITAIKYWNDGYISEKESPIVYNYFGIRPTSVRLALFDTSGEPYTQIGSYQDVSAASGAASVTATFSYDSNLYSSVTILEIGYTDGSGYHAFTGTLTSVPGYSDPTYGQETIGDSEETAITITNSIITGWLSLEKIFTGSEVDANPTFTIVGQNLGYTATLTLEDDFTEYDGAYYYDLTLPVDEYTITEGNAGVSGYSVTTYYSTGWVHEAQVFQANDVGRVFILGSSVTIEVEADEYLVIFKNDYVPNYYPTYNTLTVTWVDDEGNVLAGPETRTYSTGAAYDANGVSGGSSRTFTDFTYSGPDAGSDPITGYMNGNKNVILVYNPVIPEETPPLEDIPDGEVPLDDSPKTGDSTQIALLWLLFCASFSGLVVMAITAPKKRPEDRG
ncbi:MAG: Cna B-type domain-containing protein [Clostridia bacterium]|nr:Cna B-type domain-containing protein [Clostridia bacterium]